MTLDSIDLTDLDFFVDGDVAGAFALLRAEDPVHWQEKRPGRGFWSVTKYDDVLAVYRDAQTFISSRGNLLHFAASDDDAGGLKHSMILKDPPRHQQMREIVSRRFTPRAVATLADRVRAIASTIVDSVVERGECDFVSDIAARLPTAAICDLLGIGPEHWDMLLATTNESIGRLEPEYSRGRSGRETVMDACARAARVFAELIKERRAKPGDDLMSVLIGGAMAGAALSDAEIIANAYLLILGGQETTRNATSGGMLALIENPAEQRKFMANPAAPAAVEEFLRWTSPVTNIMRVAARDTEIGGKKIRAGERVVLWNLSANRDEDQFDRPERFDVERAPNNHVAFGYGEHFCLGAHLARLEMRVMFDQVTSRLNEVELAGPIERLRSNSIAGIKRMPIRFKPAAPAKITRASA